MFLPESFVDNFQYCIMTWNKFPEECLLPPFTNRNYGLQGHAVFYKYGMRKFGEFCLDYSRKIAGSC